MKYARNTELIVFTQDLMRELDEKEEAIKSVQDKAERLMLKNHPARLTIEVIPKCFVSILCSSVSMIISAYILDQECLHPAYNSHND